MNIGNYGAVIFEQSVEQGGFAHVGFAYYGDGDALLQGFSCLERCGQSLDVIIGATCQIQQLFTVGELKVFVVGKSSSVQAEVSCSSCSLGLIAARKFP